MNKKNIYYVKGTPVDINVNDAKGLPDIPIGTARNTDLEDCTDSGMFIEKRSVQFSRCPICKFYLAEDYRGLRGTPVGNVQRRSSAIYQLGCGHRFHAGCLLDYLEGDQAYINGTYIVEDNNETGARVPRQTIMNNAIYTEGEGSGIICPEPTCFKRCFTAQDQMLLEYFIGEENERVPRGDLRQYDSAEYTGEDPPPEEVPCIGASCTISGGKRKTKNKVKKKKTKKSKKSKRMKFKIRKTRKHRFSKKK